MRETKEPRGDFLTRSTAAYPAAMNRQLALCILRACERSVAERSEGGNVTSEHRSRLQVDTLDPKMSQVEPLKGNSASREVSDQNSLRNVHKSITPRMMFIGKQVQNLVETELDRRPQLQDDIVGCLGEQKQFSDDVVSMVDSMRLQVSNLLVRNRLTEMKSQCSVEQVCTEDYKTVIRGELMSYWAQCVGDPAVGVAEWLTQGAPAGINLDTSVLDGVCPKVEEESDEGFFDLTTDYGSFVNYAGVEENDEAYDTLQSYADKGYLAVFESLDDLQRHVGSKPTLSKIGCIIKQKTNHATGLVTTKTRIILDCKRSHVSKVAARTHKSVLPRVSDAIQSTLAMQADCRDEDGVTFLIADVVDAFWLVPLHKSERKYFCAKLRGKYFCFHRTAQGSRAAPLTFAAIIALASRWVQSVVSTPRHLGMRTEEARVQTYVDDPLVTIRGTPERQRRLTAVVLIAWMIMGFPIAVHKATLSNKLTWIGVELSIMTGGVEAVVPQDKVIELSGMLEKMLQSNVVAKKTMRTVIGKAMSIASVLFCWRPFIQELYTALYVKDSCAPKECIWTKQVRHTILWLLTFLRDEMAGIRRVYTVRSFQNQLPMVTITWDASPFGMGATLQLDGVFMEYFAIKIDPEDEQTLEVPAGRHEGQQTWEALAGLVSLRHWKDSWLGQRARLHIRSDNTGALTMLSKLKCGSKALTLIAREYALDLGQAQWKPDVISHVPGLANKNCDVLSRRWDPSKTYVLPEALRKAREVFPVKRTRKWWRTLTFEDQFMAPGKPNAARIGQEQWRKDVAVTDPNDCNSGILVTSRRHHSDRSEGTGGAVVLKRKRDDMPVVRKVDKGDLDRAVGTTSSTETKQAALDLLLSDMYAATSKKPRDALLKTWVKLHVAWFGEEGCQPFPLDEIILIRVSAMFKAGGYRSFRNYLSRAKDQHLQLGYQWNEALNRTSQKCVRSVLRGLSGASRSEAFDLMAIAEVLRSSDVAFAEGGPQHPLALIVCATFFMLRELEASAVDRADVTLSDGSVTISLPVSKTDWEAKGCKRTWSCVCDRNIPCPYHVLLQHCRILDSAGVKPDSPLFPDKHGNYCTKSGVVDTIRAAAELTGMQIRDAEGNQRLSGHTFRITGARFLSAAGLDPITIQLLGRWGSNAVLTYLAEAPLMSLNQRIKPLDCQRLTSLKEREEPEFGDLDKRVNALEMLDGHRQWQDQLNGLRDEIAVLHRNLEDHSDQLKGIAITIDDRPITDVKKVINTTSGVEHQAVIYLSASPHTWKTKCGWRFAGKFNAETFDKDAPLIHTYRTCPKCHLLPDSDDEDSTSSSNTDD
eukprot:s2395_g14.t1